MLPPEPAGVEYRIAAPDDATCVGVLATQVFLDTYATEGVSPALAREVLAGYSPEAFRARLEDELTTIVAAERRGHLIGFAEVTRRRPCPIASASSDVELVRLYVQGGSQRRGIGRSLLQRAEELARGEGADAIWLTVWSGNGRALAFYPRLGYENVGVTAHVIEGRAYENQLFLKLFSPGAK